MKKKELKEFIKEGKEIIKCQQKVIRELDHKTSDLKNTIKDHEITICSLYKKLIEYNCMVEKDYSN